MPDAISLVHLYRVVDMVEYDDIVSVGHFRSRGKASEGKWFADSKEVAMAMGELLYGIGGLSPNVTWRIVEARVPLPVVLASYRDPDRDHCGPSTYIERENVPKLIYVPEGANDVSDAH